MRRVTMANTYTGDSIVDYLKSQGKDSSMAARKELANSLGITNYSGSGTQNTQMLNMLRSGTTATSQEPAKAETVAEAVDANVNNAKDGNKNRPLGITDDIQERMDSQFTQSENSKNADGLKNEALADLGNLTNQEDIISDSVMNQLYGSFNIPSIVTEADSYIAQQLQKIQSGKTSYSDQVQAMMDKIMNRDKFSYDVDNDQLFQQALASAMNSGKQAMQDTIGQASALTGGYGSTYATSAGNQAYNAFIEDAYNNLPQYYQMAMEAYQMEGDEMYRQFGMLSELDDKEYNRNVAAYDATFQYRNRAYDEAYNAYRDSKNDAFAMANLELNEYGQRVNAASNYYTAMADNADSIYEREYNKWADDVNLAYKYAELLNTDAWANKNFDESVRQYETSLAEQKRQFDEQMAYNYTALKKSGSGGGGGSRSSSGITYKLSTTEINGLNKAFKDGGVDGALAYLSGIGKSPTDDYSLSVVENLLGQADAKIESDKQANTPKSGTISEFRSKTGDNFTVTVGSKTYGVENHGKVTNSTTLKNLNKLNISNGTSFVYNGEAYVKSGDGYYQIGAKLFGGSDYEALKKALQK